MTKTRISIKDYFYHKIGVRSHLADNKDVCNMIRFLFNVVLPILKLISIIYGFIVTLRNFLYDVGIFKIRNLDCMVISVGNITVGGTGKTPAVISLAGFLMEKKKKVAILLRGYKGIEKESTIINFPDRLNNNSDEISDEAVMIAKELPEALVITGKDRFKSGLIAHETVHPDVIILDDGYQHRKIKRDIDILILDYKKPFGNGKMLPAGTMREKLKNIKRADAIIFSRVKDDFRFENIPDPLKNLLTLFRKYSAADHKPVSIFKYPDNTEVPDDELKGKKFITFSGIGKPESFVDSLKRLKLEVIDSIVFDDHHKYIDKSYGEISSRVNKLNSNNLMTTEKDIVKIDSDKLGGCNLYFLRISFEFKDGFPGWKGLLT